MSKSLVTYERSASGELVAVAAMPKSGAVLCLDTSTSMGDSDGSHELRRIDVLAQVLADILSSVELVACCSFGWHVTEIPLTGNINVPAPSGTTPMHKAIAWALTKNPKRIVVVTDGEPDNRDLCMDEAAECRRRGVVLDAYYCGAAGGECERWLKSLVAAATPGGQAGQFMLTGPNASKASQEIILRLTHG